MTEANVGSVVMEILEEFNTGTRSGSCAPEPTCDIQPGELTLYQLSYTRAAAGPATPVRR